MKADWLYHLKFAAWILCVVVAIGGLLTALAGVLVSAWVSDALGVRLMATGAVATALGGVPWLAMVS